MNAYRLNLMRRRADTINRKASQLHGWILDNFGSCSLRDNAAELELRTKRMLDHIDTIIIGSGNP